jgi:hypothetical protein
MQGSYNENFLSASGGTSFTGQGENGPVIIDFREDINLQSSAR